MDLKMFGLQKCSVKAHDMVFRIFTTLHYETATQIVDNYVVKTERIGSTEVLDHVNRTFQPKILKNVV